MYYIAITKDHFHIFGVVNKRSIFQPTFVIYNDRITMTGTSFPTETFFQSLEKSYYSIKFTFLMMRPFPKTSIVSTLLAAAS